MCMNGIYLKKLELIHNFLTAILLYSMTVIDANSPKHRRDLSYNQHVYVYKRTSKELHTWTMTRNSGHTLISKQEQ